MIKLICYYFGKNTRHREEHCDEQSNISSLRGTQLLPKQSPNLIFYLREVKLTL